MRRTYCIITIIYTLLVLLIPNFILCFTEQMSYLGSLCNILIPASFILFILTISRRIGINIWLLFPYFFFSAFQIVLLKLYGRSIIAVDMFLNIVTTNPGEVAELLGNLLPVVGLVIILYLPVLILASWMWGKRHLLDNHTVAAGRRLALVTSIAGFLSLSVTESSFRTIDNVFPLNVCYNVYLAIDRTEKTASYHTTSKDFTYSAVPSHPASAREIYIAIVGETSRAENWQILGYTRPTTPQLLSRNDIMTSVNALSESNTTHKSVPMLLSTVSACDFDKNIYTTKSLVTAFREAGFNTAFISNQRYNHSFIDFFAQEADTTLFLKEQELELDNNTPEDLRLLSVIDNIIARENTKQLIVLHTYGSHFNYRDRYSGIKGEFLPDDYDEASESNREKLINAYDNTIRITDRLISECIIRLDTIQHLLGGIIYTSDHGEDIFDDGKRNFLHASPIPTIHQVHVPFLVWITDSLNRLEPSAFERMKVNMSKRVSPSRSYAPTLIQMAGIISPKIDGTQSLLSTEYLEKEPVYLNDHNECVPLRTLL